MNVSDGLLAEYHASVSAIGEARLSDSEYLVSLIRELVSVLGMEPLGEPQVETIPLSPGLVETTVDDGGVSVAQMITTSHLAIHTWPLQRRARIVLDSCRPFDTDAAAGLLVEWLDARIVARVARYEDLGWTEPPRRAEA